MGLLVEPKEKVKRSPARTLGENTDQIGCRTYGKFSLSMVKKKVKKNVCACLCGHLQMPEEGTFGAGVLGWMWLLETEELMLNHPFSPHLTSPSPLFPFSFRQGLCIPGWPSAHYVAKNGHQFLTPFNFSPASKGCM